MKVLVKKAQQVLYVLLPCVLQLCCAQTQGGGHKHPHTHTHTRLFLSLPRERNDEYPLSLPPWLEVITCPHRPHKQNLFCILVCCESPAPLPRLDMLYHVCDRVAQPLCLTDSQMCISLIVPQLQWLLSKISQNKSAQTLHGWQQFVV